MKECDILLFHYSYLKFWFCFDCSSFQDGLIACSPAEIHNRTDIQAQMTSTYLDCFHDCFSSTLLHPSQERMNLLIHHQACYGSAASSASISREDDQMFLHGCSNIRKGKTCFFQMQALPIPSLFPPWKWDPLILFSAMHYLYCITCRQKFSRIIVEAHQRIFQDKDKLFLGISQVRFRHQHSGVFRLCMKRKELW